MEEPPAHERGSDEQAASAGSSAEGANATPGGKSLSEAMAQASAQADPAEQLSKLAELRDRGVLSEEEFATQKARVLGTS